MLYRSVALIISTSLLVACGDSDTTLPDMSNKSAYQCSNFTHAANSGPYSQFQAIVGEFDSLVKLEYTDDTSIQRFSQDFMKTEMYRTEFLLRLKALCSESPEMRMEEAGPQALNETYAWTFEHHSRATCKAYNDGKFEFAPILSDDTQPMVSVLKRQGKYSQDYMEKEFTEYCAEHPTASVRNALYASLRDEILFEQKEEERREKEAREREIEEKKAREQAERYRLATNLLASSETNNCEDFTKLTDLAYNSLYDREKLIEGLRQTMNAMAESLDPHDKEMFDVYTKQGPIFLARETRNTCMRSAFEDRPLQEVLRETIRNR